jgi:hypothetical protein
MSELAQIYVPLIPRRGDQQQLHAALAPGLLSQRLHVVLEYLDIDLAKRQRGPVTASRGQR